MKTKYTGKRSRLVAVFFMVIIIMIVLTAPTFAASSPYGSGQQNGWLVITNVCAVTNAPMVDAHFTLSRQNDPHPIIIIATDEQGMTEAITLPEGDYYLEQIQVQQGYYRIPRIYFTIAEGTETKENIYSYPIDPTNTTAPRLTITNNPDAVMPVNQTQGGHMEAGTSLNIVPGHADGWQFTGWSIDSLTQRSDFISLFFVMPDTDITITAHWEVANNYIPAPTPAPNPEPTPAPMGRLIITSRAQGTGDLLRGVFFEVRRIMDDELVAQIVTNHFGEAAVNLPAGNYFLREVYAPSGFTPNASRVSVRITADRLTEINVVHRPIPPQAETATANNTHGRLLITNRERGTNTALSNAFFEIRGIMDDRLVAQMQTNPYGEAAVNLLPGDYYIRQISPAAGFVLDSTRTNIRITAGELLSITFFNVAETVPEVEADVDVVAPVNGRLLVTLMSGATGNRLSNGTITVHDIMTDALVITLKSDFFGEASVFLPPGRYFMRQSTMPQGYITNLDRIPVTINAGDITDMSLAVRAEPTPTPAPIPTPPPATVAPSPPLPVEIEAIPDTQSKIKISTRAAGSGNPLSGGVFSVHRAYDNRRVAELTTAVDGLAYMEVEPGLYFIRELRPTFGFLIETQRIFLEVGENETVKMELTKERDMNIAELPMDEEGGGIIYIPQTGQILSFHYTSGLILMGISLLCAFLLGAVLVKSWGRD